MFLSIVKRYVKWNELAAKAVQDALNAASGDIKDLEDALDALDKRVKALEDAQPSET